MILVTSGLLLTKWSKSQHRIICFVVKKRYRGRKLVCWFVFVSSLFFMNVTQSMKSILLTQEVRIHRPPNPWPRHPPFSENSFSVLLTCLILYREECLTAVWGAKQVRENAFLNSQQPPYPCWVSPPISGSSRAGRQAADKWEKQRMYLKFQSFDI